MKIIAVHDHQGNIARLVVSPPGGPPGFIGAKPGQLVTEVAAGDIAVHPARPETYEQLIVVIKSSRIDVKTGGKLVAKAETKTEGKAP